MKIVLLGDGRWVHSTNWANLYAQEGHEVVFLTLHEVANSLDARVELVCLNEQRKLGYLTKAKTIRSIVKSISPDIVNVHYATGYATLARLARIADVCPIALSVWGSDVYDFPRKSWFHKALVLGNLRYATSVLSTSKCMAEHCSSWLGYEGEIKVTPFGVDTTRFSPLNEVNKLSRREGVIRLGTVKKLEDKYGIDDLIKVFSYIRTEKNINAELTIVGGGTKLKELQDLAKKLGVSEYVEFVGMVPHSAIPGLLRTFDVYFALSKLDSESFGVAVLEASAVGLPVVVTRKGGLPEVVAAGKTGLVCESPPNSSDLSNIEELVSSSDLQTTMGICGREHVLTNYSKEKCLDSMLNALTSLVKECGE